MAGGALEWGVWGVRRCYRKLPPSSVHTGSLPLPLPTIGEGGNDCRRRAIVSRRMSELKLCCLSTSLACTLSYPGLVVAFFVKTVGCENCRLQNCARHLPVQALTVSDVFYRIFPCSH